VNLQEFFRMEKERVLAPLEWKSFFASPEKLEREIRSFFRKYKLLLLIKRKVRLQNTETGRVKL